MTENMELAEESAALDVESQNAVSGVDKDVELETAETSSEKIVEASADEGLDETVEAVDSAEKQGPESEMAETEDGAKKTAVDMELLQILNAQNDVLDCMLTQQKKIHDSVRDRRWVDLEDSINNMRAYSDAFVNLDQCRENYVGDNRSMYLEPEIQDVYVSVRTKLSRSKIENSALATYVSSTKEFVDGVIENCVPQSRAKVYGRNGKIMSPTAESVVLDALV